MSAKLSIVVPFYNVEDYIEECLTSLAAQTLRDFEVIMVDDGSPDGSGVVAKTFAENDSRFRVVYQENQGLGPARNTGVRNATGHYLTFVDSDDVVSHHAYEVLVASLEESGSDFACGNVFRMDDSRSWQAPLQRRLYDQPKRAIRVSSHPEYLRDWTAWNKVFRRAFWDQHAFEFPGTLYEDSPVMVRALAEARAIDTLDSVVYYWRKREGSITDARNDCDNIAQRINSVREVRRILETDMPGLKAAYDRHVIDVPLGILFKALLSADRGAQERIVSMGSELAAELDEGAMAASPAHQRLKLHFLRRCMLPELLETLRHEARPAGDTPAVRHGRWRKRWRVEYPFRREGVPAETYDVTDELEISARAVAVSWRGDRLRVEGRACISHARGPLSGSSRTRAWMINSRDKSRVELAVIPLETEGRFAVDIPSASLTTEGMTAPALWEFWVEVRARGVKRRRLLGGPKSVQAKIPAMRELGPGFFVQPTSAKGRFMIRVKRPKALLQEHRLAGESLELLGWAREVPGPAAAIVASRKHGAGAVRGQVEPVGESDGGYTFRTRIPLRDLMSARSGPDLADRVPVADEVDWEFSLANDSDSTKLMVPDSVEEARYFAAGREFALTTTRYRNLTGVERTCRPVVGRAMWMPGGRLVLTGDFSAPDDRPEALVLRHDDSTFTAPIRWDGARFTAEFPLAARSETTEVWSFLARTGTGLVAVVIERSVMRELPDPVVVGAHEFAFQASRTDALQLRLRPVGC